MEKESYLETVDFVVIGIYFVVVISVGLVVGNWMFALFQKVNIFLKFEVLFFLHGFEELNNLYFLWSCINLFTFDAYYRRLKVFLKMRNNFNSIANSISLLIFQATFLANRSNAKGFFLAGRSMTFIPVVFLHMQFNVDFELIAIYWRERLVQKVQIVKILV